MTSTVLNEKNFMTTVVKYMNDAHQLSHLHGTEKKEFVLQQLKDHMDPEVYERYHEMISVVIDGIVSRSIDKKEIVLAIKATKKCLFKSCTF